MSNDQTIPEPVAEPGQDVTDLLTVQEMSMVARLISEDPAEAVMVPTQNRWRALALMGWCLDRRRDPQAKQDTWMNLTTVQLVAALGMSTTDPAEAAAASKAAQDADDANPTEPAPA